ncbi:MAG: hypothetical protein ACOX9C_03755 [Kiritimatiellia bacterium]|jgi:hypothetical protein
MHASTFILRGCLAAALVALGIAAHRASAATPASTASAAALVTLDSRSRTQDVSPAIAFDSHKVKGTLIILR